MTSAGQLLYLGTYTHGGDSRGIYRLSLDVVRGTLTEPVLAAETSDPSYLALAADGLTLYAVNEGGRGRVTAFAVEPANGRLAVLNAQPAADAPAGPCHLAVDRSGRMLVVANYGLGSVSAFPLLADGRIGPCTSSVRHTGALGPSTARQQAPHAHEIIFSPDQRRLYVPDLGLDRVLAYEVDAVHAQLTPMPRLGLDVAPGAGPRHGLFSRDGKYFYVVDELNNTVTVASCNPNTGALTTKQIVSVVPADAKGQNWAAALQLDSSERHLYVSVRGADVITVLVRNPDTGLLAHRQTIATGGTVPRSFSLSPDGYWLVCANQGSRTLTVFDVDSVNGRLTRKRQPIPVPTPACVLFTPAASLP